MPEESGGEFGGGEVGGWWRGGGFWGVAFAVLLCLVVVKSLGRCECYEDGAGLQNDAADAGDPGRVLHQPG